MKKRFLETIWIVLIISSFVMSLTALLITLSVYEPQLAPRSPDIDSSQTIACYTDSDCPWEFSEYCHGNIACDNIDIYTCQNPGTSRSDCVLSNNFLNCDEICTFGCLNGECLPSG